MNHLNDPAYCELHLVVFGKATPDLEEKSDFLWTALLFEGLREPLGYKLDPLSQEYLIEVDHCEADNTSQPTAEAVCKPSCNKLALTGNGTPQAKTKRTPPEVLGLGSKLLSPVTRQNPSSRGLRVWFQAHRMWIG